MANSGTWYTFAVRFEDDEWYRIDACANSEKSAESMVKAKASCEGHEAREVLVIKRPDVGPDDWRYY